LHNRQKYLSLYAVPPTCFGISILFYAFVGELLMMTVFRPKRLGGTS